MNCRRFCFNNSPYDFIVARALPLLRFERPGRPERLKQTNALRNVLERLTAWLPNGVYSCP
jgi:hypothetical protein